MLTPGPDVSRILTFPNSEESMVETSQLHSQNTPSWGLGNPPPSPPGAVSKPDQRWGGGPGPLS